MEDASIIELFFRRNETAIEETDKKYGKLCFSLAENILNSTHDSEECVSDTYMAVWNCIPPNRPDKFAAFLCRITKNLAFKKLDYNRASKRNSNLTVSIDELSDCVSGSDDILNDIQMKMLSNSINQFLRNQKDLHQIIFIKRYWYYESIADIANELNISENKVSMILFRTRQKLKDYLTKEGFEL